eukprot:CAMPEP_0176504248 /NCGR_PEP_ID=MMETSP0200_2-20121128/15819_1 /TAXON_ID=947934 /ORGANISM="Chaetoceros sp., Strain GSL56" /LENGTH=389 /DNA_ID=CAMNT_0017903641 /DNA_START=79 /DNA_END=1246 /DNA_ORIENTATION=+
MSTSNNLTKCELSSTTSSYKEAYNRHRRRPQNEGFTDDFPYLLDFSNPEIATTASGSAPNQPNIVPLSMSKDCIYRGGAFGIESHPGFVYIPQALSKNIQIDLAYQALTQFCEGPHRTNIDLLPVKKDEIRNGKGDTMWNIWKREMAPSDKSDDGTIKTKEKQKFYKTFEKLSWATTGYHYDWTERSYKEELQSPMPLVLKILGSYFAQLDTCSGNDRFCASASIINYYSLKSIMGGHKDDLEYDFTKPVVSLSIGLPAVFLLGGMTKDDGPVVPILVRPGDVMLLGGESRLCYHGIARVIPEWVELPPMKNNAPQNQDDYNSNNPIQSWDELFSQMKACGPNDMEGLDNNVFVDPEGLDNNLFVDPRSLETPRYDLQTVERFLFMHRL